jgi:hypothetical protein
MPTNVGRISGPLLRANLTRTSDLAFETDLLYIAHTNGRIGINTDTPTRDLNVVGTAIYRGNLIATDGAIVGNMSVDGESATIETLSNPINMISGSSFVMPELRTDNLAFTNSGIRAYNNDNINIYPGPGTGKFTISSDLKQYGNIYATGDISFDGNIFIGGDNPDDTLSFKGDIESNLIPDQSLTYNIGANTQRWGEAYISTMTDLNNITVDNTISLAGVRVNLGIENKWYVSTNGADSLTGTHPNFAFGTIKHTLQQIQESTAGPHQVHILPGTYIEEFPLEVPANTTIKGASLRSVTIKPTVPGRFQDAFLLNDASTVTDVTIQDFQYSAVDDVGYAFRFAPNASIDTRSPYVQNVTVITQGETRTVDDPRGFDSGDAGRGALVDGAVLDSESPIGSMLFNAVTFITPGADGIILKNGVRSEIIDCFTYFADRSLYLEGASEARVIGSASVYGNKGVVADGTGTKAYCISHNFAYVGTGKDVGNDQTLIIQTNETEETNNGKVYFVSQDQSGDFRVGENFIVDLNKGTTSIAINDSELGASTLTVGIGGSTTIIDATKIEVPNFRISNNTITTLQGGFDFDASDDINLNANVAMQNNLTVTGNATIGGSGINLGNDAGDVVNFAMDFQQDLLPSNDTQSNIGSVLKNWKKVDLTRGLIDGVEIHNNIIQASDSNSNLEFRANGTGTVNLENVGFKTTISSNQGSGDVSFNGVTNSIVVNSIRAVDLPSGTTAQDPQQGNAIRYDSTLGVFETFSTGKTAMGGVRDGDYNTVIDLNSNQFQFYADNQFMGTLSSQGDLSVTRFSSQNQFVLDGNSVTVGSVMGTESALVANGLGRVLLDTSDFEISGTVITTNGTNNDIVVTGTGIKQNRYIQFDTTNAAKFPNLTTAQRDAKTARLGEVIWNTSALVLEVYGGVGVGWKSATGLQEITVTRELAEELNILYNLVLN